MERREISLHQWQTRLENLHENVVMELFWLRNQRGE
jgi:predicted thioredoxin/glutaredoxin